MKHVKINYATVKAQFTQIVAKTLTMDLTYILNKLLNVPKEAPRL